jgi:hypothetical protein
MTTEALIKPASLEEDVLSLISTMRRDNLTAEQVKYIGEQRNRVFAAFRKIVRGKFGLSDEQIVDLNDQRIETLFMMLVNRAQKSLWYQYPLHIFPVTLVLTCAINEGWNPGFNLIMAIKNLRREGDHPITGSDLRQNIENHRLYSANNFSERSAVEKEAMVQRRKP